MGVTPILFSSLIVLATGSVIEFNNEPLAIQAGLSRTMKMRCSLNDTMVANVTGGMVGRDVTQTNANVQHVTSLVVMRNNGEHVASVTQYDPAKALVDLTTLQVTGDVSGQSGERGYIELTWMYPNQAQTGEYLCEINAIDDEGHNVIFSTTLEVGVETPTTDDLVKIIRTLENQKETTQNELDQLSNDMTTTQSLLASCCEPQHIETGNVHCGDSTHWKNDAQGDWSNTVDHVFSRPYRQPPIMELGVVELDHDSNANTRFYVEVKKVDEKGFTVKCTTWADSRLFDLTVSWISVAR